jgi:bacteriophage N4 adsorption protein B
MRLRDRRAIIAAVILTSAYMAAVIAFLFSLSALLGGTEVEITTDTIETLIAINVGLLFWRAGIRAYFVTHLYGWREGLISVPRTVVGNIIAIMAARRAVVQYWRIAKGGRPVWDKTAHKFPAARNLP